MELSPFRIERFYARYEHSTRFMLSSGFGRANMPDALEASLTPVFP
jgi:hypothetical protein